EDEASRLPAQRPGTRRRNCARIDGVEVAPGWQRIESTARRRARSARRHEAPGQTTQQAIEFRLATALDRRRKSLADEIERGAGVRPGRRTFRGADQPQRQ